MKELRTLYLGIVIVKKEPIIGNFVPPICAASRDLIRGWEDLQLPEEQVMNLLDNWYARPFASLRPLTFPIPGRQDAFALFMPCMVEAPANITFIPS